MQARLLSFREAKQISIVDYLAGLGFEPARVRGVDHWYHSPYREERTPSFKVNSKHNVWFDHGSGEGGTILDLGAKLHQCTLQEFLEKLSAGNHLRPSLQQQKFPIEKPENKLEVISANILTSPNLIQYLNCRGIDVELAKSFCKEIDFRIGTKFYNAIGFPNKSGAYELRNSWFKGSSSPKDISVIHNGSGKVSVLEGFMDFLSVLKIEHPEINLLTKESDFLILNSLRLLKRSLPLLQNKKEVNLFLDNDLAANDAKLNLKEKGIIYHDASYLYGGHKDVNAYLVSTLKEKQVQYLPRIRSRRMKR